MQITGDEDYESKIIDLEQRIAELEEENEELKEALRNINMNLNEEMVSIRHLL